MQWYSLSCPVSTILLQTPAATGSYDLSSYLSHDVVIPCRVEHSIFSYFLQIEELCISVLTTLYCEKKLPWSGLRNVLIFGMKDENSRNSVLLRPLNKLTAEDSPPRLRAHPAPRFWPR